jgi:hypothetical protein
MHPSVGTPRRTQGDRLISNGAESAFKFALNGHLPGLALPAAKGATMVLHTKRKMVSLVRNVAYLSHHRRLNGP